MIADSTCKNAGFRKVGCCRTSIAGQSPTMPSARENTWPIIRLKQQSMGPFLCKDGPTRWLYSSGVYIIAPYSFKHCGCERSLNPQQDLRLTPNKKTVDSPIRPETPQVPCQYFAFVILLLLLQSCSRCFYSYFFLLPLLPILVPFGFCVTS